MKPTQTDKAALQSVFGALIQCDPEIVAKQLKQLVGHILTHHRDACQLPGRVEELIVRLDKEFPGDVGCFCALMLNYVYL